MAMEFLEKSQSLLCTTYRHKVPIIGTCTLLIDQLLTVWTNLPYALLVHCENFMG